MSHLEIAMYGLWLGGGVNLAVLLRVVWLLSQVNGEFKLVKWRLSQLELGYPPQRINGTPVDYPNHRSIHT